MDKGEESRKDIAAAPTTEAVHLSSVFKGLLFSFLSGLIYSLCAVLVKQMRNIHPGQLALYRFVAAFVFSLPQAVKTQENLFGPRELRFILLLRGICGATNTFMNFLAFRYLPLGEATVIIFSVPVFITVAARIFLKESCRFVQSIAVITTVVGIMFITKVPETLSGKLVNYTREHIYGLVACFVSLFVNTCQFIILRKVKGMHQSVIMFNMGWVAILETSILTTFMGDFSLPMCGLQQGLLIMIGVLSYIGMTLLTMAVQLEQAGPVSTMRAAADITMSFMWQKYFFHNAPERLSIAGAVLVGMSIVLIGLGKWVQSLPSESSAARKMKFLTA